MTLMILAYIYHHKILQSSGGRPGFGRGGGGGFGAGPTSSSMEWTSRSLDMMFSFAWGV